VVVHEVAAHVAVAQEAAVGEDKGG